MAAISKRAAGGGGWKYANECARVQPCGDGWPSVGPELRPVAYCHVVFTLPAATGAIAFHDKAAVYDLPVQDSR